MYDAAKQLWLLQNLVMPAEICTWHERVRISIPYGRQSQTTKKLAQKTNKSNNNSLMDLPNEEELHSTGDRNLHIRNLRQFSLKRPLNSFSHHSHTFTNLTKLSSQHPLAVHKSHKGHKGHKRKCSPSVQSDHAKAPSCGASTDLHTANNLNQAQKMQG